MTTQSHEEGAMLAFNNSASPHRLNLNIRRRLLGTNDVALLFRACLMLACAALALSPHPSLAESHEGFLHLKAAVNASEVTLLVDTGAPLSVLDSAAAAHLSLPHIGATDLQMVSSDRNVPLSFVSDFEINNTHFHNLKVAIMDLDKMSTALGSHLDGILGADVLQHFLITIDYSRDSVRLDPLGQPVGKSSFRLHVFQNSYLVPLRIEGSSLEFLLDTGTNASLISHAGWLKVQHGHTVPVLLDGLRSSSSVSTFSLTALNYVTIASHSYRNVPMRVNTTKEEGLLSNPRFGGLLGNDFLERFIVTLDLSHARISLRPNPGYRPRPFRFSTIGVQFIRDASDSISIVSVWTPSPAQDAGLRVGDRILSIDDVSTRNMSLDEVGMKLHGPVGKRVVLEVRAQDATRNVALIIRDLLRQIPSHSQPLSQSADVEKTR